MNETVIMEAALCEEHALDVRAGGSWELASQSHEILMGEDLPLEIINYKWSASLGGQTIELHLGRGPDIRQVVRFRLPEGWKFGAPDDPFLGA